MSTISMERIITAISIVPTDFDSYLVTFLENDETSRELDITARSTSNAQDWAQYAWAIEVRQCALGPIREWFRIKIYTQEDAHRLCSILDSFSEAHMPVEVDVRTLTVQIHIDALHDGWLENVVRAAKTLSQKVKEAQSEIRT